MHPTAIREHPDQLHAEALTTIAEELAPAATDTAAMASVPDGDQRGYVRISHTPSHEAWLIAWQPHSALEMHDHGDSQGAIHVVSGVLAEAYADRRGSQHRARVRTRELLAGATVAVPASRIHEVWNPGPNTAVSIHVYSPPLTTMNFYDRVRAPRVHTEGADRVSAIDRMLEQARVGLDRVDPHDLEADVADGAVLIDIRPAGDRAAEGPMPGAIVIERIHLEWRLDPTSPDRLHIASPDLRVIVVCNEGYASSLAAQALRRLGLARATDLAGGYRAWKALHPAV